MCTLTYVPLAKKNFLWTHNRDESPARAAHTLIKTTELVYPEDPPSGGTWIGMTANTRVVSLLNGAFDHLPHEPSKGKSRGIVVLDALKAINMATFFEEYDLTGIQPFTLVVLDSGRLWEFRWDKKERFLKELDYDQAHIWSSATLYPLEWQQKRKEWFQEWLFSHARRTYRSILKFHLKTGDNNPVYDLVMDRGVVRTVSVTSIASNNATLNFRYYNLLEDTREHFQLNRIV